MLKLNLEQYFFSALSAARNERVALHIITLTIAEVSGQLHDPAA